MMIKISCGLGWHCDKLHYSFWWKMLISWKGRRRLKSSSGYFIVRKTKVNLNKNNGLDPCQTIPCVGITLYVIRPEFLSIMENKTKKILIYLVFNWGEPLICCVLSKMHHLCSMGWDMRQLGSFDYLNSLITCTTSKIPMWINHTAKICHIKMIANIIGYTK